MTSIQVAMTTFLIELQNKIVHTLESVDGTKVKREVWQNGDHSGCICVLQDGNVFEKAGVTYSLVKGQLTESRCTQLNARGWNIPVGDHPYLATGLSLVFHPHNPYAPTVHLNYRYFEVDVKGGVPIWWFGGGSDLTPCYYFQQDALHFHQTLRDALAPHGTGLYPRFKKWCDSYFYLPHRNEYRGIGGIFFDDFTSIDLEIGESGGPEAVFAMVKDVANSFIPAYFPILNSRKDTKFNPEQKSWQQLRRGRYVEFNLVYDRGTQFGLKVPGIRAENILVSMPLTARWEFQHTPSPNSPEAECLSILSSPHDWLNLESKPEEKKKIHSEG